MCYIKCFKCCWLYLQNCLLHFNSCIRLFFFCPDASRNTSKIEIRSGGKTTQNVTNLLHLGAQSLQCYCTRPKGIWGKLKKLADTDIPRVFVPFVLSVCLCPCGQQFQCGKAFIPKSPCTESQEGGKCLNALNDGVEC